MRLNRSMMDDFFAFNLIIMLFGATMIGLSFSINYGNPLTEDISSKIFFYGSFISVPTLISALLTILSMKGYDTCRKSFLKPLMVYLRIIPSLMTGLFTLSFLLKFKELIGTQINEDDSEFSSMVRGTYCVLIFLDLMACFGCIAYDMFANVRIIEQLKFAYDVMAQNQSMGLGPVENGHQENAQNDIEEVLPQYDELFDQASDKDSDESSSLPGYEAACFAV